MAILNFPNNPQEGDQYTGDNNTTYIFDGVKWVGRAAGGAAGTNSIQNGSFTVQVDADGNLVIPNSGSIKHNNSWTKTTDTLIAGITTSDIIWTSSVNYVSSVKLTIQLETHEIGDTTGWHSQVCEAVVSSRGYASVYGGPGGEPVMTVYGVTHTSTVPLATFSVQRNPTTKMIEVVATRTVATDSGLDFRIHSVEMSTKD